MPLRPLEHWMEIGILETRLKTLQEHFGAKESAYAALDREFHAALCSFVQVCTGLRHQFSWCDTS